MPERCSLSFGRMTADAASALACESQRPKCPYSPSSALPNTVAPWHPGWALIAARGHQRAPVLPCGFRFRARTGRVVRTWSYLLRSCGCWPLPGAVCRSVRVPALPRERQMHDCSRSRALAGARVSPTAQPRKSCATARCGPGRRLTMPPHAVQTPCSRYDRGGRDFSASSFIPTCRRAPRALRPTVPRLQGCGKLDVLAVAMHGQRGLVANALLVDVVRQIVERLHRLPVDGGNHVALAVR